MPERLSIGLDPRKRVDAGLPRFEAARASRYGLEMRLARMNQDVETVKPGVVVVGPIPAFRGPDQEGLSTQMRMVDLLKRNGVSSPFASPRSGEGDIMVTEQGLSSLMDSRIKLSDVEVNGELNRVLYIIKSRGSSHSNQAREYLMKDTGIRLIDAYIGPEGGLTGKARVMHEACDQAAAGIRVQEIEHMKRVIAGHRAGVKRQIADPRANLEFEEDEAQKLLLEEGTRESSRKPRRDVMRRVCEEHLSGKIDLEVINTYQRPELAEKAPPDDHAKPS